jgi:nicotinate-nucleotide adenylyltransferase
MDRARSEVKVTANIGVFGGAFNPVHHGHLIAAQVTLETLNLDSIIFIPTGVPPHKKNPAVSAEMRLKMTSIAVENNPKFEVSEIEINRDGPSYTVDTLKTLNTRQPEANLHLLIGADELEEFKDWHCWQEIIKLARLAVINRPGYETKPVDPLLSEKINRVEIPNIQISSSGLRNRVRAQRSIRYFVPEKVSLFIKENELYHG